MILDDIVRRKNERLRDEMRQMTIEGWKQLIRGPGLHKPLNFAETIKRTIKRNDELSVIGEIKKASPSAGVIREQFDPAIIANEYVKSGVQAISVLTEKDFFMGDEAHLAAVRRISPIPVLRKDFIFDLWQLYQSRYIGADAVLLIVSLLNDELLKKMLIVSEILGMQCLVETHDEDEIERALEAGAKIIGINNRDLKTFEVDLKTTGRLINKIPEDIVVVSESGIRTAGDMEYIKNAGADAVLIGEAFMRGDSIAGKIRELKPDATGRRLYG